MSRYVDVEKIEPHEIYEDYGFVMVAYMDDIDAMPTADVVPVVHCKDCKKYAREEWKRKLDEPHNFADTEWKIEFSGCMGFDDPEKGYCYAGEADFCADEEKIECD